MVIGILKERFEGEQRVAISPHGVETLVQFGAGINIESNAGAFARFTDEQYRAAGATIMYSPEETVGRADIIVKVMPPLKEEYELLVEGQTLLSFLLLGMQKKTFVTYLLEHNITAIALELLQSEGDTFPILHVMSEISGQIAVLVGARYLRSDQGGRGVLLGGLAGVAPAAVVILGCGASGFAAAQTAIGLGAQVIAIDNNLQRLREVEQYFGKRITTVMASTENIRRGVSIADVFIGAISIDEHGSHHLVTEEMVKAMKPGAVIVDVSINQGGCVETSRPTTVRDPIFMKHGVVHYAVPNMPSVVARTSTYALTNSMQPYLTSILANGIDYSIKTDKYLRCGLVTHRGIGIHSILKDLYDISVE